LANIDVFVIFGAIPAAIAMLVFGVPLILLSMKLGFVQAWHFVLGGALAGAFSGGSLAMLDSGLSTAALGLLGSLIGAMTALTIWLIGIRGNLVPIENGD
jgi:hypothetical protein